jgi:hypothetical protein
MDIDSVQFIEEIEKRPAIWNMSSESYSDRNVMRKQWEEIVKLFGGNNFADNKEKQFLCKYCLFHFSHIFILPWNTTLT